MSEMGRKGGLSNRDRNGPRWVSRRHMADSEPSVALVADSITVQVCLVLVEGIGTIVYWASKPCIKFWVAETVTVCIGTRVAVIRESV